MLAAGRLGGKAEAEEVEVEARRGQRLDASRRHHIDNEPHKPTDNAKIVIFNNCKIKNAISDCCAQD